MTRMRPSDILIPQSHGLYCRPGDFYIDPVRPVARALITHGHSDHARAGHGAVLATQETLEMMRLRLCRPVPYAMNPIAPAVTMKSR